MRTLLFLTLTLLSSWAWGEGRPGVVEWSDGRKVSGAISLTPGKELGLFLPTGKTAVPLASVREITFKPEKEEMREGFYFPNAGQATQAKTGEVYPVRYLQTQITLADGKVLEGHLFTTTFYIEVTTKTSKLVVMAKQTGVNGQKIGDLAYPMAIRFDDGTAATAFTEIKLEGGTTEPIVVSLPNLSLEPLGLIVQKNIWTVAVADPKCVLFARIFHNDGETIQVSWPREEAPAPVLNAVNTALKDMDDFYDTRQLQGVFSNVEANDVYGLVLLSRKGKVYGSTGVPWSLVILRWKYDPEAGKCTLLNRVSLRRDGNSALPTVLKSPELFNAISAGVHP